MEPRDPDPPDNGGESDGQGELPGAGETDAEDEAHAGGEDEGRAEGGLRGSADQALRRLEERLDRASDAAERLFAEAAGSARREPPPAGWKAAEDEPAPTGRGELELLISAFGALRDLIPPDLQRRLAEAIRELLMALRALIDWYLERSQRSHERPSEVQDIPIL